MSVRSYENFLLEVRHTTEFGEQSSDDLSSEWDTDDTETNNSRGCNNMKKRVRKFCVILQNNLFGILIMLRLG